MGHYKKRGMKQLQKKNMKVEKATHKKQKPKKKNNKKKNGKSSNKNKEEEDKKKKEEQDKLYPYKCPVCTKGAWTNQVIPPKEVTFTCYRDNIRDIRFDNPYIPKGPFEYSSELLRHFESNFHSPE